MVVTNGIPSIEEKAGSKVIREVFHQAEVSLYRGVDRLLPNN